MTWLLGKLGFSTTQFELTAAAVLLAFVAGLAVANGWATKTAIDAAQAQVGKQAEADAMVYGGKLIDASAKIAAATAKAAKADTAAHQAYADQLEQAERERDAALAALSKERNNRHAYPDDALLLGNGFLRCVLDHASGADRAPGYPYPAAAAVGGDDGAAKACASAPSVTAGDIKNGWLALGEHDKTVIGQLSALQSQARDLGLAPQE